MQRAVGCDFILGGLAIYDVALRWLVAGQKCERPVASKYRGQGLACGWRDWAVNPVARRTGGPSVYGADLSRPASMRFKA
jgi:hypothetical protein